MDSFERRVSLRGGMVAAALLLAACAGGQRTGGGAAGGGAAAGGAGQVSAGTFSPGGTPAANYGTDPQRSCPPSGILKTMAQDIADQAKQLQKTPPQPDGRFCAIAEALVGWDEKQRLPENVAIFVANYHGVVGTPRIVMASIFVLLVKVVPAGKTTSVTVNAVITR